MPGIVVIDDSPAVRERLRARLESAGFFDVQTADGWHSCCEVLARRSKPPALILVDVNLPGTMSGDLIAFQLRKHKSARNAKIVLFSAMDERALRTLTARVRADGYMTKRGAESKLIMHVKRLTSRPPKAA